MYSTCKVLNIQKIFSKCISQRFSVDISNGRSSLVTQIVFLVRKEWFRFWAQTVDRIVTSIKLKLDSLLNVIKILVNSRQVLKCGMVCKPHVCYICYSYRPIFMKIYQVYKTRNWDWQQTNLRNFHVCQM